MYLSASRIKTFLTCSWQYHCTYNLGFRHMDPGNPGSKRGTICHLILECIQDKRHHSYINSFQETGYKGNPAIYKLVKKHADIVGVGDEENMNLMESFIKVGLKTDFLCEGWNLQDPEEKFQIESETPEFKILGFIDKNGISKNEEEVRIDDYKTSKTKFTGKDAKFNIQALTYALAKKKKRESEGRPGFKKYFVNFIFLKFPKSPLQSFEFTNELLNGFEQYLSDVYKYLKNFNKKKACSNFARNNENYFLCGKEPGDLNAKGLPAWVCPIKRPFLYWEIKDKSGKIKFTAKEKEIALDKMDEGDILSEKYYAGCPAWNKH